MFHSEQQIIEQDDFASFRQQWWLDRQKRMKVERVHIPLDDGKPITFKLHFPAGTLRPRMSAKELGTFLVKHLRPILPFFSDHPRAYQEWLTMVLMFEQQVPAMPEAILPWVQSVDRSKNRSSGDAIVLDLNCKTVQERTAKVFY